MTASIKKPGAGATAKPGWTKNEQPQNTTRPPSFGQRLLPHDDSAERELIAACLAGRRGLDSARRLIGSEDFYSRVAGQVFRRLCEFADAGRSWTPFAIIESFRDAPDFERVEDFILGLLPVFAVETAAHFARVVLEHATRRELARVCYEAFEAAHKMDADPDAIMSGLLDRVGELRARWRAARPAEGVAYAHC